MAKLSERQIEEGLQTLCAWKREGRCIVREFRFKDFLMAMEFVNRLAAEAERAQHHPDIDIRWNKVRLSLTTHDENGLTKRDFNLAHKINRISQT